jgi:hypothetical protein
MGTFIVSVGALCAVVYQYHPDKPSVPRTFPNGLEVELGGKGALPVCRFCFVRGDSPTTNFIRHGPMSRHRAEDSGATIVHRYSRLEHENEGFP